MTRLLIFIRIKQTFNKTLIHPAGRLVEAFCLFSLHKIFPQIHIKQQWKKVSNALFFTLRRSQRLWSSISLWKLIRLGVVMAIPRRSSNVCLAKSFTEPSKYSMWKTWLMSISNTIDGALSTVLFHSPHFSPRRNKIPVLSDAEESSGRSELYWCATTKTKSQGFRVLTEYHHLQTDERLKCACLHWCIRLLHP